VDIFHAEELDTDGELYLRGNRAARARDGYILSGNGAETYRPGFTYHGFRYARIRVEGNCRLLSAVGLSIGARTGPSSGFESDSPVLNGVYSMIDATARCNLLEVPTDVCARDERLGWGAEGHYFMRTAAYTRDMAGFLRKWSGDIADGQLENGSFWSIAPAVYMKDINQFAGDIHSDMGVHVPWILWRMYGDLQTARLRYPGMKRYFEFLDRNSDRGVRYSITGDWLALYGRDHSDYQHGFGDCPRDILGTAFFGCTARMMADLAGALGLAEDSWRYEQAFARIKESFAKSFLRRDLGLKNGTQTAYVLALSFGLLSEEAARVAVAELIRDISGDGRGAPVLTCGTAGTPFALTALDAMGQDGLAASIAVSEEFPSLGYMRKMGATTVWERWDGIREGRRFHPHPMNAFSHIGLATIGEWIMSGLAGIRGLEPGFARYAIDPGVSVWVRRAKAEYASVRGHIRVDWVWEAEGGFLLRCELPPNTRALVRMPSDGARIAFKALDGDCPEPSWTAAPDGRHEAELGSGSYELRSVFQDRH
jgi:alpha-L-rhamnosidase